jgi:putative salt-induced outer membrane protein YdiY
MNNHRRLLSLGLLAAVLVVVSLRAEVWVLKNGDRITAQLIEEDEETVEIEHPQLGRLRFAREAIKLAPRADAPRADAPPAAPGGPAAPTVASVTRTDRKPVWKQQIEIGLTQQSGKTEKQDLVARYQVEGRVKSDTFRGTARYLQGEVNGNTTNDRREADFRWRHDFSGRLFAQSLTTYYSDDIRRVENSIEQQLGGGYRVLDVRRHKANVGLGAVGQYLDRQIFDPEIALLGTVFQDYALTWSDRLKLTQESSLQMKQNTATVSQPGADNYRAKFNAALQSKITSQLLLNIRFEMDYDATIADQDLRSDQRLITSVGYSW